MQITAERAYWILEYYRRHWTVLAIGGRILGEDAACEASISHVWPENQAIGIKLLSDDRQESWDRLLPLNSATFNLVQMGEAEFERFGQTHCHSILIIIFPDQTTIFLAEHSLRIGGMNG
jgi:hypothetical protein